MWGNTYRWKTFKEFADTTIISIDAGARFNEVLSKEKLLNGTLINSYYDRVGFAYRNQLPKKSSMEYSLVCANDTSTKFTREWKIGSAFYHAFNTSNDYWNTFCLNGNITLLPNQEYSLFSKNSTPAMYINCRKVSRFIIHH